MTEPMCRICLAEDIRMYPIVNTHLQGIYESLTTTALETNDSRSLQACYICCARLQNCYKLRKRCLQSEELYTRMLRNQALPAEQHQEVCSAKSLEVTAVVLLSVGDVLLEGRDSGLKLEAPDGLVDVVVKKEDAEDTEDGPPEDNGTAAEENVRSAESEDDVPLGVIRSDLQLAGTGVIAPTGEPRASTSSGPNDGKQVAVKVEAPLTKKEHIVRLVQRIIAEDRPFYFQCRACKKSFYRRARLNGHRCAASDAAPYQCAVCRKRFQQKGRLLRHVRRHAEREPYRCDVCRKRFQQKGRLLRHVRRHAEREPYRCDVCHKCFDKKYQFTYHVRSHTGEKPYRCEVCDKRFITKGYLLKHSRMHSGERPHRCHVCNKGFKGKSNLKVHVRQHTGEKPYQCSVCKKRFNYNGNLKKHLQMHSGERPHGCDACGKRFINNSDLAKHRRTHTATGRKPFQCEVCGETFNYNSNFLKHKRVRCKPVNVDQIE